MEAKKILALQRCNREVAIRMSDLSQPIIDTLAKDGRKTDIVVKIKA